MSYVKNCVLTSLLRQGQSQRSGQDHRSRLNYGAQRSISGARVHTYPKGVHSYRYFLQPMSTSHTCMTKEFEGRKYLYECTPFGYVNL